MRTLLEPIIAAERGGRTVIESIRRKRFPYVGSYKCEVVTVTLGGGEDLFFFLKDFGRSRKTKDDLGQRRDREMRVYRDLLAQSDLGTAAYCGSIWDESRATYWLLLELVGGVVVEEADGRHGPPAAAWLARLQEYFRRHERLLAEADFLIRHDAAFFHSKADESQRNVSRLAPACAGRLARALESYGRVVDVMTSQPLSLVHGGYIPWHVLLDTRCEPVRVCAVDWESAAVGATLYDLAFFTDGVRSPARERIYRAYRNAAIHHAVPVPDEVELPRVMDCFRFHRILDWLSRGIEKGFSEGKVSALVGQAEKLSRVVLA